jgi:hypothetical protein
MFNGKMSAWSDECETCYREKILMSTRYLQGAPKRIRIPVHKICPVNRDGVLYAASFDGYQESRVFMRFLQLFAL